MVKALRDASTETLRFDGILQAWKLAPHKDEMLRSKLEAAPMEYDCHAGGVEILNRPVRKTSMILDRTSEVRNPEALPRPRVGHIVSAMERNGMP